MSNYHLKIAYTVDNQNFETASPLEIKMHVEKKKKRRKYQTSDFVKIW